MEVEPALALDATPSQDGLTWVIKLRKGVRFSNGEIFDAHAAKANIDHLIHDPTRLGRSAMFGEIVRADATDLYELTIHLKKPHGGRHPLDGLPFGPHEPRLESRA